MANIRDAHALGIGLKAARLKAGTTQAELAARSGVSRRTIINIESGHPTGEIGRIITIVRALGLRLALDESPEVGDVDLNAILGDA